MKIILAINAFNSKDPKQISRHNNAVNISFKNKSKNVEIISLNFDSDKLEGKFPFMIYPCLKRHSKDIGTSRDLPYIKEILDYCSQIDCDIFGYMNLDVILDEKFFTLFNDSDAYLFMRTDIGEVTDFTFGKESMHIVWNEHPGYDCICFKKDWWLANRDKFHDDLIIGEPFFDYFYAKTIKTNTSNFLEKRALYHVYHETTWDPNSAGGENNKRINGGTAK